MAYYNPKTLYVPYDVNTRSSKYELNTRMPPITPNTKAHKLNAKMMQNWASPIGITRITYGPRGAGLYSSANNINMSAQVPNSSVKKLEESRKQLNEAIAKGKAEANARAREKATTTRPAARQTTLNRFGFSRNGKKGGTRRLRRTRKH